MEERRKIAILGVCDVALKEREKKKRVWTKRWLSQKDLANTALIRELEHETVDYLNYMHMVSKILMNYYKKLQLPAKLQIRIPRHEPARVFSSSAEQAVACLTTGTNNCSPNNTSHATNDRLNTTHLTTDRNM